MKRKIIFLFFGICFGFALSRVGASDFDLIYGMFTGTELKLAWVMITAIVVGNIGMRLLHIRGNRTYNGEEIKVDKKPLSWRNAVGGLIFGLGWGSSGACPGTVLAQLGEGKILALFTVAGLILGTYLFALLIELNPRVDEKNVKLLYQ